MTATVTIFAVTARAFARAMTWTMRTLYGLGRWWLTRLQAPAVANPQIGRRWPLIVLGTLAVVATAAVVLVAPVRNRVGILPALTGLLLVGLIIRRLRRPGRPPPPTSGQGIAVAGGLYARNALTAELTDALGALVWHLGEDGLAPADLVRCAARMPIRSRTRLLLTLEALAAAELESPEATVWLLTAVDGLRRHVGAGIELHP